MADRLDQINDCRQMPSAVLASHQMPAPGQTAAVDARLHQPGQISITRGFLAQCLAGIYFIFVFALPPSLDAGVYAGLITAASAAYVVPSLIRRETGFANRPFLLLGLIFLVYLAISLAGIFDTTGFIFSRSEIPFQAAGLGLFFVLTPALAKASRHLLVPRPRNVWMVLALVIVSLSVVFLFDESQSIFRGGQLYGTLAPPLLLQFLYFVLALRISEKRLVRLLILLAPFPFLGASSNQISQLVFIALVLFARRDLVVLGLAGALAIFISVMVVRPAFFEEMMMSDLNTAVRSHLWQEASKVATQRPLGIGYGTSYTSLQAARDPFIAHVYQENPLEGLSIANHNSFIDLALRLGWAGLACFIALLVVCWRSQDKTSERLVAAALISMVMIVATFNPALESARASPFMALVIGYLIAARRHPFSDSNSAEFAHDPMETAGQRVARR